MQEELGFEIEVRTPPCFHCGKASGVIVSKVGYDKWMAGALIQDAFASLSVDDRELLISGTHPKCWDELMGNEDA